MPPFQVSKVIFAGIIQDRSLNYDLRPQKNISESYALNTRFSFTFFLKKNLWECIVL